MKMKYIKSAARLFNRYLSKEVLLVSVGQRAAELRAIKFEGQKKILPLGLAHFDLQRPTVPL